MKKEHSKLKLRPLRRTLHSGTFVDLRLSKRYITATLRCFGAVCSCRTPARGCRLSHSHSSFCSSHKTQACSWNNLVCSGRAVLSIFACRRRCCRQGGQATIVVGHTRPPNCVRIRLGNPDCYGPRTVLAYRYIVNARWGYA